jgi:GNAT superfamily N-acetyltransferase
MIAPEYRLRTLEPPMAAAAGMTFPAFRHMLDLAPTERFPGQPEQRPVQALGATAWQGDALAGLGLAEVPRASDCGPPEVLSLFVHPQHRNRGLATALLAELENRLGGLGFETLDAVYMTGKPGVPAIERILAKRDWTPPETRTVTLRFTPEEASKTPWYGRLSLPRQSEIFSWVDLPPGELEEIQRCHEEKPWIADGLEPWRHVADGFDPVSSVGLRYRGQVVGWVINHRLENQTVRFTCSYMRKDLSRRARIVPLYTESLERLRATGCRQCMFVTPVKYRGMVAFVKEHCAPWVGFFGETRGASKSLGPKSATSGR